MKATEDASIWSIEPEENFGTVTFLAFSRITIKSVQFISETYLKFQGLPVSFRIQMLTKGVMMEFDSREAEVEEEMKPRFEDGKIKLHGFLFAVYPPYTEGESVKIRLYAVDPEEWSERTITYRNAPPGEHICDYSLAPPPIGANVSYDIAIPVPHIPTEEGVPIVPIVVGTVTVVGCCYLIGRILREKEL